MHIETSIWEAESFLKASDFIIVGAGFAGLWCAFELKRKHAAAKILILEKGIIPTGASTRNAGFACFGSPTEMLHDIAVMGEDKMWSVVEMRFRGIEKIKKLFSYAEVDFDECGGYECLQAEMEDEIAAALPELNLGLKTITGAGNCFEWCNNELQTLGLKGFSALVKNRLEGGLHSGKLLQALKQKVLALGVKIFTGVEVLSHERNGVFETVTTANGHQFKTGQLILCTNAFTDSLTNEHLATPARGQIIVTSPIENLGLRGTFHYDEGYYYFRNVGNRVLLGGARNRDVENERTTELVTSATIQKALEIFLSKHILPGQQYTIDYRWSGIMAFTTDKLPVIKKLANNTLAVIGCNGMGVALLPIIAEEVAALF